MAEDEKIAKAFNAAYDMQKHAPDMIEKLLDVGKTGSEIVEAAINGAKQFQKEKIATQQQEIKERAKEKSHKR